MNNIIMFIVQVLTRDSVTVSVDAVVYYRVSNATVSVANVENAHHSTRLLAQTTLRNILGTKNLHEILSDRESISGSMQVCTTFYICSFFSMNILGEFIIINFLTIKRGQAFQETLEIVQRFLKKVFENENTFWRSLATKQATTFVEEIIFSKISIFVMIFSKLS